MRKGNELWRPDNARGIARMNDDRRLGLTMIIKSLRKIMKTKENILADIFIIPNPSFRYESSIAQKEGFNTEFIDKLNRIWYETTTDEYRKTHDFKDESWVQVWYVTPGSEDSNWCSHTINGYEELKGWKPIAEYLPKSLFDGKKEGDCITVILPIHKWLEKDKCKLMGCDGSYIEASASIKVQLQLSQLKYRYRRFGRFEDTLTRV